MAGLFIWPRSSYSWTSSLRYDFTVIECDLLNQTRGTRRYNRYYSPAPGDAGAANRSVDILRYHLQSTYHQSIQRYNIYHPADSWAIRCSGMTTNWSLKAASKSLEGLGSSLHWLDTFYSKAISQILITEFLFSLLQNPFLHGFDVLNCKLTVSFSSPYSLLASDEWQKWRCLSSFTQEVLVASERRLFFLSAFGFVWFSDSFFLEGVLPSYAFSCQMMLA